MHLKRTEQYMSIFLSGKGVCLSEFKSHQNEKDMALRFMLRESKTCYFSNFIIYAGSSTDYGDCQDIVLPSMDNRNLPPSFQNYKLPSKVVLSLMKPFLN